MRLDGPDDRYLAPQVLDSDAEWELRLVATTTPPGTRIRAPLVKTRRPRQSRKRQCGGPPAFFPEAPAATGRTAAAARAAFGEQQPLPQLQAVFIYAPACVRRAIGVGLGSADKTRYGLPGIE
jgi:hypothetical protein